jgi:hypothetical protein
VGDEVGGVEPSPELAGFVYPVHEAMTNRGMCARKQNVDKHVTHSIDFRIEGTDGRPRLAWESEGLASASNALALIN